MKWIDIELHTAPTSDKFGLFLFQNIATNLSMVQDTLAMKSTNGYSLTTLAKTNRGYEIVLCLIRAAQFIPESHFLFGDAPQSKLAIQTGAYEVAVIFGVETDRWNDWGVVECTKTLRLVNVPQATRLVRGSW